MTFSHGDLDRSLPPVIPGAFYSVMYGGWISSWEYYILGEVVLGTFGNYDIPVLCKTYGDTRYLSFGKYVKINFCTKIGDGSDFLQCS